jgi:hypothetical protein
MGDKLKTDRQQQERERERKRREKKTRMDGWTRLEKEKVATWV